MNLDGTASSGGDAAGDTLTSIEHVIGSASADTLNGTAAAETLDGGAGDDILRVDTVQLNLGGFGVDGGTGSDTVNLNGAGTLDSEVNLTSVLNNVEIIDFTGVGVDANLVLSGADVQSMTDGSNALRFEFDAGDSLAFTNPADVTSSTVGTTTTHSIWTDNTHTTLMATLVENVN